MSSNRDILENTLIDGRKSYPQATSSNTPPGPMQHPVYSQHTLPSQHSVHMQYSVPMQHSIPTQHGLPMQHSIPMQHTGLPMQHSLPTQHAQPMQPSSVPPQHPTPVPPTSSTPNNSVAPVHEVHKEHKEIREREAIHVKQEHLINNSNDEVRKFISKTENSIVTEKQVSPAGGVLLFVQWSNHNINLRKTLSLSRKKGRYSDVTLACEGKLYNAHKFVLSMCSEYFETIFEEIGERHPVVVLTGVKSEELEYLLSFMYNGRVHVTQDKLAGLLRAAESLQIKGLAVPDLEPELTSAMSASGRRNAGTRPPVPLLRGRKRKGGMSGEGGMRKRAMDCNEGACDGEEEPADDGTGEDAVSACSAALVALFDAEDNTDSSFGEHEKSIPGTSKSVIGSSSSSLTVEPVLMGQGDYEEDGDSGGEADSIPHPGKDDKWPVVFPIRTDKFPGGLLEVLESKGVMTPSHERQLIQVIYETVISFTKYPSRSQFLAVVCALLQKYPHLDYNLPSSDAHSYWRSKLSHKMRNSRWRQEHELPASERKRVNKKRASQEYQRQEEEPVIGQAQRKLCRGVKNFLPENAENHDLETIQAYLTFMREESSKEEKNYAAVETAMTETFTSRRHYLINRRPTVLQLKEKYPCLFDSTQMLDEFKRIAEFDLVERMRSSLNKYAEGIVKLCDDDTENNQYNPEVHNVNEFALRCIVKLMKEEFFKRAENGDQQPVPSSRPMLVLHGDDTNPGVAGHIVAEDVVICQTIGLFWGLCVWFATCFVFNTFYPKCNSNTLTFIQKVMLELESGHSTPLVTRIRKRLNEFVYTDL